MRHSDAGEAARVGLALLPRMVLVPAHTVVCGLYGILRGLHHGAQNLFLGGLLAVLVTALVTLRAVVAHAVNPHGHIYFQ